MDLLYHAAAPDSMDKKHKILPLLRCNYTNFSPGN